MPNAKISALTSATTPLAGTEVLPIVQSSTTKKVAVSDLTSGRNITAARVGAGISPQAGFHADGFTSSTPAVLLNNNPYDNVSRTYGGVGIDPSGNGNVYIDTKTATSGTVNFRCGAGAEYGYARTWLSVNASTGNTTVQVGNLVIGTAGKGIDFSANGGDVLTQYDEGTWTVRLYDDNNAGNQSSTTATGYYTRIGNQVTITFAISNVSTAGMTGANPLWFSLPFTPNSTYGGASGACSLEQVTFPANMTYISPLILAGTARGVFRGSGSAANTSSVLVQNISSGVSDVERCTVTYFI